MTAAASMPDARTVERSTPCAAFRPMPRRTQRRFAHLSNSLSRNGCTTR
jgi:hypothetical protein